jgi:hypothetical protein
MHWDGPSFGYGQAHAGMALSAIFLLHNCMDEENAGAAMAKEFGVASEGPPS